MTSESVLRDARERISDPKKWGQGLSIGRPGTYCLAEAICVHDCERKTYLDARSFLCRAIGAPNLGGLTFWNDQSSRTHAEVLDALDRAIDLAQGES